MGHVRYLIYVLKHRWYTMLECFKAGLIWRGLLHDLSKFRPSEWFAYVGYFYPGGRRRNVRNATAYYKPTDTGDAAFDFAWLLHQKRNDHHWQWWVLPEDEGGLKVLRMSDRAQKEMLCDWRGAGRAQGTPDTAVWYEKNKQKMNLHPDTRMWVEAQLETR